MEIKYKLVNNIPTLSLVRWDEILKSDIVVDTYGLDALHSYYVSLIDAVDWTDFIVEQKDIVSIQSYVRDVLWLD